ncbi:calmodulin-2/4 [Drosophila yakuba]|uniref:EF-hand domain-containing protein n=1 Tax=Drosophila yakuba TaxID=7245 RepID=B4PCN3_DROYA|nr:calmodulin-2/4 [Drosophila yakuba]EDW92756.1 uncharacterized protein Dyak_GE20994 [Drosophila yakuba]
MESPNYTLSNDDLQDICEAFALCDPQKTGRIGADDLGTVMRALGQNHTESEIYRYSEGLEGDVNGFIELADFIELMTKIYKLMSHVDYLKAAYNAFDSDKDGLISYTELRHVFANVGEKISDEEFDDVFRQADTDGDGVINFRDFYNAYRS